MSPKEKIQNNLNKIKADLPTNVNSLLLANMSLAMKLDLPMNVDKETSVKIEFMIY